MAPNQAPQRFWKLLCAAVLIVGVLALGWLCWRSPRIAYLPRHNGAEWIVYPWPVDPGALHTVEVNTVFKKSFVLDRVPASATLSVRALWRMQIAVNGTSVDVTATAGKNWKDASEFQVAALLHPGTNEIVATAFHDHSPPALWLRLKGDSFNLASGTDWEASLEGAAWRPARIASDSPGIQPGSVLSGGENTSDSFRRMLPTFGCIAVLGGLLLLGIRWMVLKFDPSKFGVISSPAGLAVVALAIFWVALFINNRPLLPKSLGFDVMGHLAYVDYIKTHHALPLATDGWEMCQPPLYYIGAAGALWVLQLGTFTDHGIEVVRFIGMFAGIANIVLIYLCLRLIFPRDPVKQLIGVLFAGCLPAQIYISQYVTNECLLPLFVTGAIYFALRIIIDDRVSWLLALGAGACLGAALLTKVTALLAVPCVGGALLGWAWTKRRREKLAWTRVLVVFALSVFVVCGWHYYRVWHHFGTPIVHDWDPVSGFSWWGFQGYQTAPYFTRFGHSLVNPFHGEVYGFADGLYATLWGDGLCGSCVPLESRPPWNYQMMSAGYLLALVPTALMLIGGIGHLVRIIRKPEPENFLLTGLFGATIAALVYFNLKQPFYCNDKAFYGLVALMPVAAFAALGWELIARISKIVAALVSVALICWAMNGCLQFWIRADASATHLSQALHNSTEGNHAGALQHFALALRADLQSPAAYRGAAAELLFQGRFSDAETNALRALALAPKDPQNLMQLAVIEVARGRVDSAVEHGRSAVETTPDLAGGHRQLSGWLMQLKRYPEAAAAGVEALRLEPMNPLLQLQVGSAFAAQSNHLRALQHFGYACDLGTNWAEPHAALGKSLLALNRAADAARQFSNAVQFKPKEIAFRIDLAGAYAESGQASQAINAYRDAMPINPQSAAALSGLAWLLATAPDDKIRDGAEAVTLAERAAKIGESPGAGTLMALAAAYAEAGRFTEAVAIANKAISATDAGGHVELAQVNRELLKRYEANSAYHQPALHRAPFE